MVIVSEITIDLLRPGAPQIVHAKQGDSLSRTVRINLLENGAEWDAPSGASFSVCYAKPDGTGGRYEQISTNDGVLAAAVSSGNTIDVNLHPQALACAGVVQCEVCIQSGDATLSTFAFFVKVQASAETDITSEDYWSLSRDDRTVFVSETISTTAGTLHTFDADAFLTTPHVKDAVIGLDGYAGKVTGASGDQITVEALGQQWICLGSGETANAIPFVRGHAYDGNVYTTTGDGLPVVVPGSDGKHTGKGTQIIFVPGASNTEADPSLQINGGEIVPIKIRAASGSEAAVTTLPVGALKTGVPYTMTFCGEYWLVDSVIGPPCASDEVEAATMRAFAARLVGLSDSDGVFFPIVNTLDGVDGELGTAVIERTLEEEDYPGTTGVIQLPSVRKVQEMIDAKFDALDATGVSY